MKKKLFISVCVAGVVTLGLFGCSSKSVETAPTTQAPQTTQASETTTTDTYANLQTAVQGETTAAEKYIQFAKIAGEEGNTAIQKLFLATASAEQIHIKKEYELANATKAYEAPKPQEFKIGTSEENLQSCIEGELYESETMYPEFVATAEADGLTDAKTIFVYARDAEASHAVVFSDELKLLQENGTYAEEVTYYVCPICGKLEKGQAPGACSICGAAGSTWAAF